MLLAMPFEIYEGRGGQSFLCWKIVTKFLPSMIVLEHRNLVETNKNFTCK